MGGSVNLGVYRSYAPSSEDTKRPSGYPGGGDAQARAVAAGGGRPLAAACVNSVVRQQPGMVQAPNPMKVLPTLEPPEKTSGEICGAAMNPWLTSSSVVRNLNFQQL